MFQKLEIFAFIIIIIIIIINVMLSLLLGIFSLITNLKFFTHFAFSCCKCFFHSPDMLT